jgi:hypothetical protein
MDEQMRNDLLKDLARATQIPEHYFTDAYKKNVFTTTNNFFFKIKKFIVEKIFWLSVLKKEKCLFSRRNGKVGKIIKGYSIRLRIFRKDLI